MSTQRPRGFCSESILTPSAHAHAATRCRNGPLFPHGEVSASLARRGGARRVSASGSPIMPPILDHLLQGSIQKAVDTLGYEGSSSSFLNFA